MKKKIFWAYFGICLIILIVMLFSGCSADDPAYVTITGDLATIPIDVSDVTDLQAYLDAKASLTGTEELTNKTLSSSVGKGTWTADGTWTLPSIRLSGMLNMNAQSIIAINTMTGRTDASIGFYCRRQNAAPNFVIYTTGVSPGYADTQRLGISGGATIALATWVNINQDFGAGYTSYTEMSAPGAGAVNTTRVYAVEGGDELTDLCAVFQDGTVDIFAQEATLKDDVRFKKNSGTKGDLVMLKPHPGLILVVMLFDDGNVFELKRIEYHDYDLIMANKGCDSDVLPDGWLVETAQERQERALLEQVEPEVIE